MNTHAHLQARVLKFLWAYEALVISACIAGGAVLTFGQGGSLSAATPLILVASAELLRIPVAAFSTRLDGFGRFLALVVLLAIAVVSFDSLSLIFEQFLDNRSAAVLGAQQNYDLALTASAQQSLLSRQLERSVEEQRKHVAALDADIANAATHPPVQPPLSGHTCGKNKSTCVIDRKAREDFTLAQAAHLQIIAEMRAHRAEVQKGLDAAVRIAVATSSKEKEQRTTEALHALENARLLSPMHRLAASLVGVKVINLTEDQFETIKKYGVIGLAGAFATISMFVSLLAHQPERIAGECKLSRSIRKYVARKRRLTPLPKAGRAAVKERIKYVYVPVHTADKDSLLKKGMTGEGLKAYKDLFQ